MERFNNKKAKMQKKMTGTAESISDPKTILVRNFEPRTPVRRSAKSFSRLRASTKQSASVINKIKVESATKTRVCCELSGLRIGVRLKAFCEKTRKTSNNADTPSAITRGRRRCQGVLSSIFAILSQNAHYNPRFARPLDCSAGRERLHF